MSTAFIVNPEISIVISCKSLPKSTKSQDEKSSHTPTEAQVQFSKRELELLKKVNDLKLEKSSTNEKKKEKLMKRDTTTTLTLSDLKELKKELENTAFLCDIIDGAELKLPENEIVERNPVLEKRIQRLKVQQEQRVYDSMTKNVDSSRKYEPEETISFQCKFQCICECASQVTLNLTPTF